MGTLYFLLNFSVNLMLLLKVKFIDFLKTGMWLSLITGGSAEGRAKKADLAVKSGLRELPALHR